MTTTVVGHGFAGRQVQLDEVLNPAEGLIRNAVRVIRSSPGLTTGVNSTRPLEAIRLSSFHGRTYQANAGEGWVERWY
jgi:hypothetical protein